MNREQLMELARQAAQAHGLDAALVLAICEKESSWNPLAVRYEPGFESHAQYGAVVRNEATVHCQRWHGIPTVTTEIKLRCISFGPMQVLGQVAREMGFQGQYLTELAARPDSALEYACKKLARCLRAVDGDVHRALLAYNGGSDPHYDDAVLELRNQYLV